MGSLEKCQPDERLTVNEVTRRWSRTQERVHGTFRRHMLWLFVCFSCFLSVCAHRSLLTKPSCDGDFGSSTEALAIPDPSISWAFSHFADCSRRAVWLSFVNPSDDFLFYVGVGVPTVERYAELRADALIVGPGLPELSAADLASLNVCCVSNQGRKSLSSCTLSFSLTSPCDCRPHGGQTGRSEA